MRHPAWHRGVRYRFVTFGAGSAMRNSGDPVRRRRFGRWLIGIGLLVASIAFAVFLATPERAGSSGGSGSGSLLVEISGLVTAVAGLLSAAVGLITVMNARRQLQRQRN